MRTYICSKIWCKQGLAPPPVGSSLRGIRDTITRILFVTMYVHIPYKRKHILFVDIKRLVAVELRADIIHMYIHIHTLC